MKNFTPFHANSCPRQSISFFACLGWISVIKLGAGALRLGRGEERPMNTNIDTGNIPVGGTVYFTNADGSLGGYVRVTKREVYDFRGIGLTILATVPVIVFIVWLCNRQKSN